MKLFVFPNVQCGLCHTLMDAILSEDLKTFQIMHDKMYDKSKDCPQYLETQIFNCEDFTIDHEYLSSRTKS